MFPIARSSAIVGPPRRLAAGCHRVARGLVSGSITRRAAFVAAWIVLPVLSFPCVRGDERQAATARWVDSVGGRVVHNATGDVVGVELSNAWLTDADLERLVALPALESIDLAYTKVTDLGLEELAPLQHVRRLNLYYAESITDLGIAHLKHWRHLEYLNVRGTKVTSSLFESVARFAQLRFLDVGHSRVNDDLFDELTRLEHLEHLGFGGNKMSGVTLPLLKSLPGLRELDVAGQQRTDSGLWSVTITDFNIEHIAALDHLRRLDLGGTAISDRGVARLSRLRQLETLDLGGTRVTARGLAALQDLPQLGHLKLRQAAGVDDASIPVFLHMEQLKVLELPETAVTSEGLQKLAAKTDLEQLFLGGVSLKPEQVAELQRQMPHCRVSWWPKPEIAAPASRRRG